MIDKFLHPMGEEILYIR